MADQKALVTLKDGTKITVDDLSQLSQYSNRQDLDSISFFGDDEIQQPQQLVGPIQTSQTVTQKEDARIEAKVTIDTNPPPDVKPPAKAEAADPAVTITVTIGALAGALSSAGTPVLTNLVKNFIKNKLKGKKGESKPEEEKEQPTDCKTHQIKASAKFTSINARLSALEGKNSGGDSSLSKLNSEDIEERLEKLEKAFKALSKKGKR